MRNRVDKGFLRIPKLMDLLEKIEWDQINLESQPVRFHGDLHFENVILA